MMHPASGHMLEDIENFYTNVVTPAGRWQAGPKQQQMLDELGAICDAHGVRCIFAVLPYLPNDLSYYDMVGNWEALVAAKRDLMQRFPVLDLTLLNRITNESPSNAMMYWTDVNHFTPLVGSYIADRLAGRENPELPANFGVWLTPETFDARMAEWRAGLDAWKADHPDALRRIQATLDRKSGTARTGNRLDGTSP